MRQTLLLLTSFVLLLSCNNTDTTKVLSNTATTQQQGDTTKTKTARQILIEELKRLQAVFASNDKEQIANLFPFPLSNETVGIYIDDSTFNAQLDKNGNKVTKPMCKLPLNSGHMLAENATGTANRSSVTLF